MIPAGSGPVLVTGGTSGIGLGIAKAVVASGRPVTVLGRDPYRCEQAAKSLADVAGSDGQVLALAGDTTNEAALHAAVDQTLTAWGRLDGLVTSAGQLARGSVLDLSTDGLRAAFETNVVGTWLAIRAALPVMLEHAHGRIVTIGSVLGTVGAADRAGYAASKGAVAALTRSLALEVAGRGVTANCVAPGPVLTPLNATGAAADDAEGRFVDRIPLGRWGRAEDVAPAVLALLSADAAWTTGSVVHVDGGYTAR